MKKIVIFTNHYNPEQFRINDLSKSFSKTLDLKVITQIPNYPKGDFYSGYGLKRKREERFNNIDVKRLFAVPRKQNSFMLVLNYISYFLSTYTYGLFTRDRFDHVFVYATSPIFLSYGALKLARRNKVSSTLYLLDLWPESLFSILNIRNKVIQRFFNYQIDKIYKRFDHIIVGSESFIDSLCERGISADKITYIPQNADEILDEGIKIIDKKDELKLIFTGNVGEAQGLEMIVEALELLKKENITNVKVTILGDGRNREAIEALVAKKGLEDSFKFLGRVPKEDVLSYLEQNHFGIVSLRDLDPLNKTLPAKVQSYMSYGLPILSCGSQETAKLIDSVKCGLSSTSDTVELAETIKKAMTLEIEELRQMGYNGNQYSKDNFDLEKISEKMLSIMKVGN